MSASTIEAVSRSPFLYRELLPAALEKMAEEFRVAKPFPYIHIRDFLRSSPDEILAAFPGVDWPGWGCFSDPHQHRKLFCNDIDLIPPELGALIHELNSPPFLRFLESVTGIPSMLPDPYLEGGGLHCSGPGGTLSRHTDFHFYKKLRLYRRVNVLLYLNREWKPSYGGCLELFGADDKNAAVTVNPEWGSCVIFKTDDRSVHGFTQPIRGDRWRRSIALYYYSSVETAGFSGDSSTYLAGSRQPEEGEPRCGRTTRWTDIRLAIFLVPGVRAQSA